jgi:AraC family transcriptional regulator of adaptative response/methylated-DNA-[protein]-cysteine methyltransferase
MSQSENCADPQSTGSDPQKIAYAHGESSLGYFLAAVDSQGLCAILFGDDRAALAENLRQAFPDRLLAPACPTFAGFVVSLVSRLIEQPTASTSVPLSIRDGDFGQMVRAALSATKPGTTRTPAEVAAMIGASLGADANVRKCAANDILAVAVPFHRLQEQDGTSPAYRWGGERRQKILAREVGAGA